MISKNAEHGEDGIFGDTFSWDGTFERYATGYGNIQAQFWLGLTTIYNLNQQFGNNVLRVEATTHNGSQIWVEFDNFQISNR